MKTLPGPITQEVPGKDSNSLRAVLVVVNHPSMVLRRGLDKDSTAAMSLRISQRQSH